MRKILFELWGIEVYSYGLMIALGILFAGMLFIKRAKKAGYSEDNLFDAILCAVISGVLGGKLLYIIVEIKTIIKDPSILLNFGNGFVIYGAIILGALGLLLYCKIKKWNYGKIFDFAAPAVALAQGFGRIGCLLAGCCYGAETDMWFGITFPSDSLAPSGVHLHPTQIYSSVFDFALAVFLILYSRENKKDGRVFSLYVIAYSVGRFFVEFLRNDPRGSVGFLSTSQFIAIGTFILGIVMYNIHKFKRSVKKVEN